MILGNTRESRRLRRLVGRVRSRVRRERAFGMSLPEWLIGMEPLWKHGDWADLIAHEAGCDWLYNRETGEVRFFEYA